MAPRAQPSSDTEKLEERNRELFILNAIAQALNREVDLQRALRTALAKVVDLLDLRTGWIWLLREDSGESYLAAAQSLPPGLAHDPQRMEGTCYCLDTFRNGDLAGAANVNVITCSRLRSLVDGTGGLRYHASIPLYAGGKKLGVLNVASSDWRELSPEDLRLLYTVGDLISIAVERARLFARRAEVGAVEERNRLAREIHDTLAQGLTGIVLQLETAEVLLEGGANPTGARQAVAQALSLARANLEEARRSVHDLRAAPLEGRTLNQALAELAREWTQRWSIQVSFTPAGDSGPLPVRVEAGLYRIAQEALANIVRHAGASHAHLALATSLDEVSVTIEDDGRGFDPEQIPRGRYGLVGLKERARLLGGTLQLQSSPGAGTRIQATVPRSTRG